ncbi:MAG: hypothetical protein PHV20_13315 [Bacteroidales bacterium]|nr:hypothetical protein [Bacteroidales bacterium]
MNNRILIFTLFILFSRSLFSQDEYSPWAFELSTGKNEYRGERGNGYFRNEHKVNTYAGLGISPTFIEFGATRYLNSSFDANFQFSRGDYGIFWSDAYNISGTKTDFSFLIRYKLNNGRILSEDAFLSPFATIGLGMATYSKYENAVPPSFILPIGIGLKMKLSPFLSFQYQLLYTVNTDDKVDQLKNSEIGKYKPEIFVNGVGDNFLKHTIGIVLNFGNFGKSGGKSSIFNNGNRNSNKKLYYKK